MSQSKRMCEQCWRCQYEGSNSSSEKRGGLSTNSGRVNSGGANSRGTNG